MLRSDLCVIARLWDEYVAQSQRVTSHPEVSFVRGPRGLSGRAPVRVGMVVVREALVADLVECAAVVGARCGVRPGADVGVDGGRLAGWLAGFVPQLSCDPGAPRRAEVIGGYAAVLVAACESPCAPRVEDYSRAQRAEAFRLAKVSAEEAAELVASYSQGRFRPTARQIRGLAQRGVIDSVKVGSSRVFWPAQVYSVLLRRAERRGVDGG